MGYAFNNAPATISIGSPTRDGVTTVSTVSADIQLEDMSIAALLTGIGTERIFKAFLEIHVPYLENTHAALNRMGLSHYIQVKRSGAGAYTNAIYIPQESFSCPGSTAYHYGVLYGREDISQVVKDCRTYGQYMNVKWNDAVSIGDDLNFYCIQTVLTVVIN